MSFLQREIELMLSSDCVGCDRLDIQKAFDVFSECGTTTWGLRQNQSKGTACAPHRTARTQPSADRSRNEPSNASNHLLPPTWTATTGVRLSWYSDSLSMYPPRQLNGSRRAASETGYDMSPDSLANTICKHATYSHFCHGRQRLKHPLR